MHLYIVGFGNQAKAWAHNLKDSNVVVTVVLRSSSSSKDKALQHGFKTCSYEEIANGSTLALLIPDEAHKNFLSEIHETKNELTIIYAHGHSMVSENLVEKYKNFNHLLFAPKGIAKAIRDHYLKKIPLGAVYSLEYSKDRDRDEKFIKELGHKLGINNLFTCTFKEETYADLFSEQSILCSLLPYAANYSFKKLRSKGIPKELAYFECWYEIKLIADVMVTLGPQKFFDLISPNALFGSELGKEELLGESFSNGLDKLLENITNSQFDESVSNINMNDIRKKVASYWDGQELSQVHSQLAPNLYSTQKGSL